MNIQSLKQTMIFDNMSEEEITAALAGLHAYEKNYTKGSIILHSGSTTDHLGLVLQGSVTIENNDIWGNRTILSHVGKNQFFAETYSLLKDEPLLVDVVANEDCQIAFLRISDLGTMDSGISLWQHKLMANLLSIAVHKNLLLSKRSFHISPKTIRRRVMSYLNSIYIQKERADFHIPFDRQQLADYLNVERTALSKELRKMQEDGLIEFHKNHFTIRTELS